MSFPWITDPRTKEESVSVTIVALATLTMIVAIGLELAGKAKATNLVTDFFWGSLANYVGKSFVNGRGQKVGLADSTPVPVPAGVIK